MSAHQHERATDADPRAPLLAFLVLGVVALASAWWFWSTGPCDDDFIVQRYARNVVEGRGLVFDAGRRVEGFTCPLLVGLDAAAIATGIGPSLLGRALEVLAPLACVLLALARARHRSLAACLAAAAAVALSAALAFHAAQGLGTALAAALVTGGFVALERAHRAGRGFALAATLLGLATLLRPETALLAPGFAWAAPRGNRAGSLVALALLIGGWVVFRRAYFGEWLPMTYFVKKLPLADDLGYGLAYLGRATLDCGIAALLAIAVVARVRGEALVDRPSTAALAGVLATTAAVVWAGGDYMELARFLVPVLPLASILACDALAALLEAHPARARAALALVALFGAWPASRVAEFEDGRRFNEERWIAIGEELARSFPSTTRVALSPIGAVGWHSRMEIVDLLGLTNDAVRHAEPDLAITMKGHHRYDAEWVLAQEPDLFVLGNGVVVPGEHTLRINQWEEAIVRHPRFAAEYEQRVLGVRGSYDLFCFQRRADTPRRRPAKDSDR